MPVILFVRALLKPYCSLVVIMLFQTLLFGNEPFLDKQNFLLQIENYSSTSLVQITSIKFELNTEPRSYPLRVTMSANVLKNYRGEILPSKITLVEDREEITESVKLPINKKYFYFFNKTDYINQNTALPSMFQLHHFNKKQEVFLSRTSNETPSKP
jgi:hypothetical protein